MRTRNKLAAATLGALSLVGGMGMAPADAAPADMNLHTVTLGGNVTVRDDEVLNRRNKTCHHVLDDRGDAQLPSSATALLDDTNNTCGGEVRVEVHLASTLQWDGGWCVSGEVLLYEGARDSSNDLDGRVTLEQKCGAAFSPIEWDGQVNNTAEGGDWGKYSIDVIGG
jgi:hypothetical protein